MSLDDIANFLTPPQSDSDEDVYQQEDEEICYDGVLLAELVEKKLTNLARTADGKQFVYKDLNLSKLALIDIGVLAKYTYVQKLNLSHNDLTDLNPLGNLPFLSDIDASHNRLTDLLHFFPPNCLKSADFSFNCIGQIGDLSVHHYLQKLILDNNEINEISGLEFCHRLEHLSLAHNHISCIEGLTNLPLKHLDLRANLIQNIENLSTLCHLRTFFLFMNRIKSLSGLENHDYLEILDLGDNLIVDLWELRWIENLPLLRNLNLVGNPLVDIPDYRLAVLYYLERLTLLDSEQVQATEKVEAANMFDPSKNQIAARDHMMHVVYRFIQPCRLLDTSLPNPDTPYPILVLVGPEGSGKRALALKLTEDFQDYFGCAVPYTTRQLYPFEKNGTDYYGLLEDDFRNEIKKGQFLLTYSNLGHWFGITTESIENVAKEGLACVCHMELEGALSLKNSHFEPRNVLVTPKTERGLESRLRERGTYSEDDINYCLDRISEYNNFHKSNPSFFDYVLSTDDVVEAYQTLRQLVLSYLGLSSQSSGGVETGLDQNVTTSDEKSPTIERTGADFVSAMAALQHGSAESVAVSARRKSSRTDSRGAVEEASVRRRQDAAKEALSGHLPSSLEEMWRRFPDMVAYTAYPALGGRSFSAPAAKIAPPFVIAADSSKPPPDSPDSSVCEIPASNSKASSCLPPSPPPQLTDRSQQENGDNSMGQDQTAVSVDHPTMDDITNDLTLDQVDRISLTSGSFENHNADEVKNTTVAAILHEAVHSKPQSISRPGSNKHKVLPPINTPESDNENTGRSSGVTSLPSN